MPPVLRRPSLREMVHATVALFLLALVCTVCPAPARAANRSWSQLDLSGVRITALAVSPSSPNVIFAGTSGQGIFRSTDRGATWQAVNSGLGSLFVNSLSIDPTNPSIILAATGRGALVGEPGGGVYRSTNSGDSWTGVLINTFSSSLARTFQSPQVIYAAGVGPVFRSTNGGVSWTRLTPPANSPIVNTDLTSITVSPFDPNLLVAVGNTEGGTGRGFRSTDAGATWTQ